MDEEADDLIRVREKLTQQVQKVFDELAGSSEDIELPVTVQFNEEVSFDHQQARTISATVLKGIAVKQILIAVSQSVRDEPIEVGYLQPMTKKGKFISAIISPDYDERLDDTNGAIKKAIVEMHALDLISAASGVELISHGIAVDRIVYSINIG